MTAEQRIVAELEELGYEPHVVHQPGFESGNRAIVVLLYPVQVGPHRGKEFFMGLSMQGKEPFPDFAPHWIHVCPAIRCFAGKGTEDGGTQYAGSDGREWAAFSRSPTDWNQYPVRDMSHYMRLHARAWWRSTL